MNAAALNRAPRDGSGAGHQIKPNLPGETPTRRSNDPHRGGIAHFFKTYMKNINRTSLHIFHRITHSLIKEVWFESAAVCEVWGSDFTISIVP